MIEMLLAEMPQYRTAVPPDEEGQKRLLRSLMNVRPVWPANRRFLEVQDEYLRREAEQKGVVDSEKLPAISWNERLVLWQGDITALKVDGIVNAANSACWAVLYRAIPVWIISFTASAESNRALNVMRSW